MWGSTVWTLPVYYREVGTIGVFFLGIHVVLEPCTTCHIVHLIVSTLHACIFLSAYISCSYFFLPPYDQVTIQGEWSPWVNKVPKIEVETHKVGSPDVVVPTLDTVRHESLLYTWLAEHRPLVLCGPPGSGKTMTLFSALRSLPDMEVSGCGKVLSQTMRLCA
jgi:type IV secretory pathway ATPase VirB11/archaellum biosynthesis ATPase